jgi:hypothetical protein
MLRKAMFVIVLAALLIAAMPMPETTPAQPTTGWYARPEPVVIEPELPAKKVSAAPGEIAKEPPPVPGWNDPADVWPNCRESHVDRWCQ